MTDAIDDFVASGVQRYAEAQSTVTFFRDRVFDILDSALKEALKDGFSTLDEAPEIRRSNDGGVTECWITLYANVVLNTKPVPRKTRIELGVWWNPVLDKKRAACVVYANFRDDDRQVAVFDLPPDSNSRVRAMPSPKWTRVCVTVDSPPSLRQDALDVIEVLRAGVEARTG